MSSLNPVMMPTVPIRAATPSVMPAMETTVFNEIVRFRVLRADTAIRPRFHRGVPPVISRVSRNGMCRPLRGTIAQGRHSPASTALKIRKKGVNKEKAPSIEEAWIFPKASPGFRWPELPVPPPAHLAGPIQRNRPSRRRPRFRRSCNPPSISSFRARQWRPGGMRSSEFDFTWGPERRSPRLWRLL